MADSDNNDASQQGENRAKSATAGITYPDYMQLNLLLKIQRPQSAVVGKPVHDEHLFIIVHQSMELWFKQIIVELDSVRNFFIENDLNEGKTLLIIERLNRMALIFKLLEEPLHILETMTPITFMEFRDLLAPSSGFQSLQFRLIENKLGLKEENRIKYNKRHYREVFHDKESLDILEQSLAEPSLLELVQGWLSRTPGIEKSDFGFWKKYKAGVDVYLKDCYLKEAESATDEEKKKSVMDDYKKNKEAFDLVVDEKQYQNLYEKGERRLSHRALQGAILISLYRDQPRFHQPFRILQLLQEIDSLFANWRHNHAVMAQRMIGSRIGTGGSSGYLYLRSTVSDRYKVFLDLFNLSNYIIPKEYIPPLTSGMIRKLSVIGSQSANDLSD